jgi:hypothetical protein
MFKFLHGLYLALRNHTVREELLSFFSLFFTPFISCFNSVTQAERSRFAETGAYPKVA